MTRQDFYNRQLQKLTDAGVTNVVLCVYLLPLPRKTVSKRVVFYDNVDSNKQLFLARKELRL